MAGWKKALAETGMGENVRRRESIVVATNAARERSGRASIVARLLEAKSEQSRRRREDSKRIMKMR